MEQIADGAGKGDMYRRVDKKKYDANYDRIYNKKLTDIQKDNIQDEDKNQIEKAVKKVVKEYGEVLRKLGEN